MTGRCDLFLVGSACHEPNSKVFDCGSCVASCMTLGIPSNQNALLDFAL